MKLEYEGHLTAGYYNDMEAGDPVFIDGDSLSDIIKDLLKAQGLNSRFVYYSLAKPEDVKNPLIGKKARLTLEVLE